MHFVTLRYGILTIGTWDSFFPSSCFSGQNGMLSATEQNQTYHNSFFFTIVSLQFSKKFCFSGCLFLIANSKLVISVGKRGGLPRRLCFLIRELFRHKKIVVLVKVFWLLRFFYCNIPIILKEDIFIWRFSFQWKP